MDYYERNREKVIKRTKEYYHSHREEQREKHRLYYQRTRGAEKKEREKCELKFHGPSVVRFE
jgi:hypothetical protein